MSLHPCSAASTNEPSQSDPGPSCLLKQLSRNLFNDDLTRDRGQRGEAGGVRLVVDWPPRGPNAGTKFSFLPIIKHRKVTRTLTAFSL
jgi:hypothetical protein